MSRVVLYVRLSRQDKAARAKGIIESCAVQREDGAIAVKSEPTFTLIEIIEHDDLSGTRIDRLDEIRAMARRREFEVLAIRDLERFARFEEPARTMALLQELLDAGVRVWIYRERKFVPLSGPEAIMTFVQAMTAGAYVATNRKNIAEGLRNRALHGQAMHKPPFGYRTNRETMRWEKVDDQVAIVQRVVRAFLEERSLSGAATKLNKLGVRSPTGVPWRHSMVRAILVQPLYRGTYVYGVVGQERRAGKPTRVRRGESELLRVPHPELRIISPEQEQEIDQLLMKPAKPWAQATDRKNIGAGHLECAVCGGAIVAGGSDYMCDSHRTGGCPGPGYRVRHHVDTALVRICAGLISDEVIAETVAMVRAKLESQPDTRAEEIARVTREIAAADRKVRILRSAVGETEDKAVRAGLLVDLGQETERLGALKNTRDRLDGSVGNLDVRRVLAGIEERVRGIRDKLASGGVDEQRAVVDAVLGETRLTVSRVVVGGRKRWQLAGRVDGGFLLDQGSDREPKLGVKGNVTGVTVTPITAPTAAAPSPATQAAPVPPVSPATPAPPPAQPVSTTSSAPAGTPAAPATK